LSSAISLYNRPYNIENESGVLKSLENEALAYFRPALIKVAQNYLKAKSIFTGISLYWSAAVKDRPRRQFRANLSLGYGAHQVDSIFYLPHRR
jgi:hypothetical protein